MYKNGIASKDTENPLTDNMNPTLALGLVRSNIVLVLETNHGEPSVKITS